MHKITEYWSFEGDFICPQGNLLEHLPEYLFNFQKKIVILTTQFYTPKTQERTKCKLS